MTDAVIEVTDAQFKEEVLDADLPVRKCRACV